MTAHAARAHLRVAQERPRAWINEYGEAIDPLTHLNRRDFERATPRPLTLESVARIGTQQTRWRAVVRCGDDRHDVRLGTTPQFTSRAKFRAAIYEATGSWLPRGVKDEEWDQLTSALHACAELEDHDATDADQTRAWLADYLAEHLHGHDDGIDLNDRSALARMLGHREEGGGGWRRDCFRDNDQRLHLRIDSLVRHVTRHLGRTTRADLAANLAALGFENVQHSARVGGDVLKGRYWQSPAGFDPEERA